MNTTQLECFVAVADTLSFARAAERLHVTQPTVTHQIKTLEAELGTTLLNRNTRHVSLTTDGRLFLSDAESILSTTRRAIARYHDETRVESTYFRLGCRSFTHARLLARIFRELSKSFEHFHPDLFVEHYDSLHQQLVDGSLDAIIDFAGMGDTSEVFTEVARVPIVCICLSDSPLASRDVIWPQDMEKEVLAITRPKHAPRQMRDAMHPLLGNRPSYLQYTCDSPEAIITIVQAGLAVSVQPNLSVPPDPQLATIPLGGMEPIPFGVYTHGRREGSLVDSFIELAKIHFAQ